MLKLYFFGKKSFILFLPLKDQLLMLLSEEIKSSIKNLCTLQINFFEIRKCCIRPISSLLYNAWMFLENSYSSGIECLKPFGSLTDAKRAREDMQDFIKDIFKGFALGAIGRPVFNENEGKKLI